MKSKWLPSFALLYVTCFFSGLATLAEEVAVESVVSAVTLYRDQALVTRTLILDGPAGAREVVVGNLPENIVQSSLFAEGGDEVAVRAVRFRVRAAGESPRKEVRELQDELQVVQRSIQLTNRKMGLLTSRAKYLDKLETFSAKTANSDLDRGVLDAEGLEKLTNFAFAQRDKIVEAETALQTELESFEEQQNLLKRKLSEITNTSNRSIREAVLYLEKGEAGDFPVQLNYLVGSCGWSPTYTVRAEDGAEVAKVEYNGLIQQMSGEDWNQVQLTLSTASPALSAAGPGLAPFRVTLAPNLPSMAANAPLQQQAGQVILQGKATDIKALLSQQREAIYATQNAVSFEDNFKSNWGLNDTINQFACAELTGDEGALDLMRSQFPDATQQPSFHYALDSPVSLPSRNSQQIVRILQTELPSVFYHVATPILTSYVYREAELNNTSQTDLLAGPISVYLDERFVGRGEIPTVARGQEFVVGFGADSQLRTRRELVKKTNGINGGNRETNIKYRVVIENYKDADTAVRVIDRMPTTNASEDLRVTLDPTRIPLSEDDTYVRFERSKGILRWDTEVPARTRDFEIEFSFTMEYDRNFDVTLPTNAAKQEEEFQELQNLRRNRR